MKELTGNAWIDMPEDRKRQLIEEAIEKSNEDQLKIIKEYEHFKNRQRNN